MRIALVMLVACGSSETHAKPVVAAQPIDAAAPVVVDAVVVAPVDDNRFVDEAGKLLQHCSSHAQGDHVIYSVAYDQIDVFEAHGEIEIDKDGHIVRTDMHTTIGPDKLDDLLTDNVLEVPSKPPGGPRVRVTLEPPIDVEIGDAPCLAESRCAGCEVMQHCAI